MLSLLGDERTMFQQSSSSEANKESGTLISLHFPTFFAEVGMHPAHFSCLLLETRRFSERGTSGDGHRHCEMDAITMTMSKAVQSKSGVCSN